MSVAHFNTATTSSYLKRDNFLQRTNFLNFPLES